MAFNHIRARRELEEGMEDDTGREGYERSPAILEPQDSRRIGGRIVRVKRANENARIPEKKSVEAAAFDLYALEHTVLQPGKISHVRTGISIELPKGFKGEIYSRSGLASKGIIVANQPGKIDSDYRGELIVLLQYNDPRIVDLLQHMRRALVQFTKDFVSANQFTIENAKNTLRRKLNEDPLKPYDVMAGERIAQFEIQEVVPCRFEEVTELEQTERGDGGFGSTGK